MDKKKSPKKNQELYRHWNCMWSRVNCSSPTNDRYYKDVKVCDDWKSFEKFADWAKHNGYIEGANLELDRMENDYSPESCQWVTHKMNCSTRRNGVFLKAPSGEIKNLSLWCEELNLSRHVVMSKVRQGFMQRVSYEDFKAFRRKLKDL